MLLLRASKIRMACWCIFGVVFASIASAQNAVSTDEIKTFAAPSGVSGSPYYAVSIEVDGVWEPVYVYCNFHREEVSTASSNSSFSWTTFEITEPVQVRVDYLSNSFNDVVIRPLRHGVAPSQVDSDTVEFSVSPGQKLSVEFDTATQPSSSGVVYVPDMLMLFADEKDSVSALDGVDSADIYTVTPGSNETPVYIPESDAYVGDCTLGDADGKSVVYFPPGVYDIGYWQVPNNIDHIHIAGGALVYGAIDVMPEGLEPTTDFAVLEEMYDTDRAGTTLRDSFKLTGPGVLSSEKIPWRTKKDLTYGASIHVYWAHIKSVQLPVADVLLEDLTIISPPFYALTWLGGTDPRTHGLVDNIKIAGSWAYNNDGMPNLSDAGSAIRNSFFQCQDDSIKVVNSGSLIENCVFWQGTNGACFQFGWVHRDVSDVTIRNIDVIHFEANYTGNATNRAIINYAKNSYSGASAFTLERISFEDITVEGEVMRLFGWSMDATQSMRDFSFRNINVTGGFGIGSVGWRGINYFRGPDYANLEFKNFVIEDNLVTSLAEGYLNYDIDAGPAMSFTTGGSPMVATGDDIYVIMPESEAEITVFAFDGDGVIVSYEWRQVAGPDSVVMQQTDQATLSLQNLEVGQYRFFVEVVDDQGDTGFDIATLQVLPEGASPINRWVGDVGDVVDDESSWGSGLPQADEMVVFRRDYSDSNNFLLNHGEYHWASILVTDRTNSFFRFIDGVVQDYDVEAVGNLVLSGASISGSTNRKVFGNESGNGGVILTNITFDGSGMFLFNHNTNLQLVLDGVFSERNGRASIVLDGAGTPSNRAWYVFRGNKTSQRLIQTTGSIILQNTTQVTIQDDVDISATGGALIIGSGCLFRLDGDYVYRVARLLVNGSEVPAGSYDLAALKGLGYSQYFTGSSTSIIEVVPLPKLTSWLEFNDAQEVRMTAAGGEAGHNYRLLKTNDLSLPLNEWTEVASGVTEVDGSAVIATGEAIQDASFYVIDVDD